MNSKKILVVDDEETARITLEALLKKEGYELAIAKNGKEAIEKIKSDNFDVALVDLVMPDMDGMFVLNEIKAKNPGTHVIMITGFGTIESAVEAMKVGATDYISKPFKKNEIENLVRRTLEEAKFTGRIEAGEEAEDGFELFKNLITHGSSGLCITKQDPAEIEDKYELDDVPINPLEGPDKLASDINEFIKNNENAVVLVDGIEQLVTQSSIDTMKKFISDLNDNLTKSSSRAILLYDSKEIDARLSNDFMQVIARPYTRQISDILSHPLRRDIIRFLGKNKVSIFTSIKQELEVEDPPKLSFHLRNLRSAGIIEQDSERRYFLTDRGEKVNGLLGKMDDEAVKDMQNITWLRPD
jgi:DNA-binding response OmpR family regulator/DNA-binding transcriptional ArsR family regulator